ncbi:MAG: UDP-4-amino-4,6-dideoxy-N-acetyl-beta-L-altrosamine transaminase [Hyphomonas sp.]
MIPYGRQSISQADIDAVVDVLKSDFLTQGPAIDRFETAVANACEIDHAVAFNSATSALHIGCLALGVGAGDLVWTSPISFVASSNCALYCGADIDFVDIDPATFNMSVSALAAKLKDAKAQGRLPKLVIPVHLAGQPCDMAGISALSREYGFAVMEDASHAIGGRYQGQPIGNCEHSDITVFSFHPVKIVTSAEGGMATTRDPKIAGKLQRLRTHGITRDPELMTHAPDGGWYYQQIELGYNYRMTDLQAALGASQMTRVHEFVAKRHEVASRYDEALAALNLPIKTPFQHADSYSGYHLYIIQLTEAANISHLDAFTALRENGIGVNLHYIPIHTQPYYQGLGFKPGDFPVAEDYYSRSISIPLFHAMSDEQHDTVIEVLQKVFG